MHNFIAGLLDILIIVVFIWYLFHFDGIGALAWFLFLFLGCLRVLVGGLDEGVYDEEEKSD